MSDWVKDLKNYNATRLPKKKTKVQIEDELDSNLQQIYASIKQQEEQKEPSLLTIPRFYFKRSASASDPLQTKLRSIAKKRIIQRGATESVSKEDLDDLWDLLQTYNEELDDKINYEGFCEARKSAQEKFKNKFEKYFSPSVYFKFHRDPRGKIHLEAFFNYVCAKAQREEWTIMLMKYDTDNEGCLQDQDIKKLIEDQLAAVIVNAKLDAYYKGFYLIYCARKFFFFADPLHKGKINIKDLVSSPRGLLADLQEVKTSTMEHALKKNYFSTSNFLSLFANFTKLDADRNKKLSKRDILKMNPGFTDIFLERLFQECPTEKGELTFSGYVDLQLALQYKKSEESLHYFWKIIDVQKTGFITLFNINLFFREIQRKMKKEGIEPARYEDVKDEIFDMVKPVDPYQITLKDLKVSGVGHTVMSILTDVNGFWAYDNRESQPLEQSE